jgi:hypothetical protein
MPTSKKGGDDQQGRKPTGKQDEDLAGLPAFGANAPNC